MNTQQESRQAFDILWITQHEQEVKFVTLFQRFPRDNQKAEETSLTSTDQQYSQPAPYSIHCIHPHTHTHTTHSCAILFMTRVAASRRRLCPARRERGRSCCGYGPKHSHMLPLPLPLPQCCCFGQQKVFFILAFTSEGKFYLSFAVIAKPTTKTTTYTTTTAN